MIIPNSSNITFDYVLPNGETISSEQDSNIVTTEILTYSVPKVKTGDKIFIQEGETTTHTVTITNNSATKLFNNIFKDTMTAGASYVAGSVVVNGVSQPAYNPVLGFPLPDLDPTQAATVSYTIIADNPLTQNQVTNYATLNYTVNDPARGNVSFSENTNNVDVEIISNRLTIVKSVDKNYAVKGDILHYTSVITNVGTIAKTNITFKDPIPVGTTFVNGSVKINGVSYPAYNPQIGFAIPNLAPSEAAIVEFDVEVN